MILFSAEHDALECWIDLFICQLTVLVIIRGGNWGGLGGLKPPLKFLIKSEGKKEKMKKKKRERKKRG